VDAIQSRTLQDLGKVESVLVPVLVTRYKVEAAPSLIPIVTIT